MGKKKSTCVITKSRQLNSTQSIKLSTKKMDGKGFAVVECLGLKDLTNVMHDYKLTVMLKKR